MTPPITIKDLLTQKIAKMSQNISIRRFTRYQLGIEMSSSPYQRILLKISGELLAGDQGYGIDLKVLDDASNEIGSVVALGLKIEVKVVIGGGHVLLAGVAASATGMGARFRGLHGHAGDHSECPCDCKMRSNVGLRPSGWSLAIAMRRLAEEEYPQPRH